MLMINKRSLLLCFPLLIDASNLFMLCLQPARLQCPPPCARDGGEGSIHSGHEGRRWPQVWKGIICIHSIHCIFFQEKSGVECSTVFVPRGTHIRRTHRLTAHAHVLTNECTHAYSILFIGVHAEIFVLWPHFECLSIIIFTKLTHDKKQHQHKHIIIFLVCSSSNSSSAQPSQAPPLSVSLARLHHAACYQQVSHPPIHLNIQSILEM